MNKQIKNVEYGLEKIFEGAQDFLPLLGTDYVEFYVGNAKQAAHYYKTAFGYQSYAYAGLETGLKDRTSYVLKQDKIRLVLTTALNSNSPIGEHVKKHGDGVKVIALWVEDARKAFEETFLHEQFFKVENNREEAFNCVDLHELEGLLGKAVNQLPPQQKKVFELSRMQGLKHVEIARQLNISGETVKKHIMEALRNVKSYLASHGQTEVSILLLLLFIK